ncbi:MAG: NUDIX domain-containing protein [Ardenticatenaceae bacterium]|nr:NUDIX domain-containing protein [Ardenticatenaceae bacterium]
MTSYVQWLRGHVGRQKVLLVTVAACVRDENGRLLWQRRGDFGWWGIPGGMLELDESLPDCVVREVKEETGLDVRPTRLVGMYTSPEFDVTYPNGDEVQQVTAVFECQVTGGQLQADGGETLDLMWRDVDDIPETAPWYRVFVADLRAERPEATFQRGREGQVRASDAYFKFMRRYVGQAEYIMPSGVGFVQNEAGHVLLQRRGDNGRWGLPGGAMELGERIDQTVINEVLEETGLHVEPVHVVGVYSDGRFRITYPHGDKVKAVSTMLACRVVGGELKADGVESLEVRFFPPDALPPMPDFHAVRVRDGLAGRVEAVF